MSPEAVRLEQRQDYQGLAELLQAKVPENWPPKDWEPHVLEFVMEQMTRSPELAGWNRYTLLHGADGEGEPKLAGCCNAFPVSNDEAEFGYITLPQYEGRGFATEAAMALLAFLREVAQVRFVRAHTFSELRASVRVLEKCGLTLEGEGEEPGTIRYRMELRPESPSRV